LWSPNFWALPKPGNGAADRPLGLVDLDARVASLEARVDAQAAQIEALVAMVSRETGESHRETDTSETAESHTRETEFETGETRQSHDADQPWIAAGVSRATWFRRQRQAAAPLPANVIRLKPRDATTAVPSFGSPRLRGAP
jgi:hypothetical protein